MMKRIHEAVNSEKGFTLVELLVVIGIIGILAMMLLPQFSGMRDRARIASCQSNLKNIGTQLEAFYADIERYPNNNEWAADFAGLKIGSCPHDQSGYVYVPGGTLGTMAGSVYDYTNAAELVDPALADDATGRIDTYVVYCGFHDGTAGSEPEKTQLVVTNNGVERLPR